jgi:hypothetical protein
MGVEVSYLQQIAGGKGSYLIHNTSANTGKWSSLVAQEDTVIAAALDNNGRDLIAYWNISGEVIKQGAFLSVPINTQIVSVTLTSGSVIGYNA